jgi:hypothetical protein
MSATESGGQAALPVTLARNSVHTEVVLDGSGGLEIINLTDAAGAGQPLRSQPPLAHITGMLLTAVRLGVAAARRTSHDHDPLRLRGREQHTGALVAGVDLAQTG